MALKHTPYFHQFVAFRAEMVDRIGFDSAFKFTSVENEHLATRNRAGVYDVYYQVLVDVKGSHAEDLLQRVLVNDVGRMSDGKVMYTSMCNAAGGMIDDLTCFDCGNAIPQHHRRARPPAYQAPCPAWARLRQFPYRAANFGGFRNHGDDEEGAASKD
jgi:hypothetical protein